MRKSAIILAGGLSSRFGQDKGLLQLAGKPLIRYVLESVDEVVDEKIVVVSCEGQVEKYLRAVGLGAKIVVDNIDARSPLIGAITGFEEAFGEYSLLIPCDTPFISRDIILLLLELCVCRNACVPRWPNGHVEPLQAVYRTKPALEASRAAFYARGFDMRAMLNRLHCVRYVSTLVLEQIDSELRTFFNVNTPQDLRRAEFTLNHQRPSRSTSFR
jgi:molybdopterin-guanine dinucleotide biosynthesis protein A